MKLEKDTKLVTAILPKGKSKDILTTLFKKGYLRASANFSRGFDLWDPLDRKGNPQQVEKEIVTVVVTGSEAEAVFELIYDEAKLYERGNGIVYIGPLTVSNIFELPADVPLDEELQNGTTTAQTPTRPEVSP